MGDLFHQTNAQQTATSQQIGVSNRDVGGSVITAGAGANVNVQSLDPAALNVAAIAVHDALASNTQTSLAAFQAYQDAIHVTGETQTAALQLAASGAGSGASVSNPQAAIAPFNPSALIWAAALVAVAFIAVGYFRKK